MASNKATANMRNHQTTSRLWDIAATATRQGIACGFVLPETLLPGVAHVTHCARGDIDLLTAHEIAIDAIRYELAALRAGGEA